jgi:hypothetical protein
MPLFLDQENAHIVGDIICYPDEKQAELINSWKLPIKLRVQKHIELLRKLRADQERITNQTPLAKAL